jgi:hypothetical protein
MNIERVREVLRQKRVEHPELVDPLSWRTLQRICRREDVELIIAPCPRPARLAQLDDGWSIIVDSKLHARHHTSWGAHELAHLWLHVDPGGGRLEACMNYSWDASTDPREDEADFLAHALIYGPRYFSNDHVASLVKACQLDPDLSAVYLEGDGRFRLPVVGESFCEDAFLAICGPRRPEGYELLVDAVLVPEQDNRHDTKAVRVEVKGKKVGYLSRSIARRYRMRFGRRTVYCRAKIIGGWDRGGNDTGHFGVRLDLGATNG